MQEKECPACKKIFKCKSASRYVRVTCSRECSNSYFVRRIAKVKKTFECEVCGKTTERCYTSKNRFCSSKCCGTSNFNTTLERFKKGEVTQRGTLRKILTEVNGYKCSECDIAEWNDKPITLQVHHVDGNCTNNMPDNLKLVCPNCHSQTSTFGSRNAGNGRGSRGLSYGF